MLANIKRRMIMVTGFISSSSVFVATNDVLQKIIARRICRWRNALELFKFCYLDFSVFFAEE